MKLFKKKRVISEESSNKPTSMDVLTSESPFVLSEAERADMTKSCHDADYIPKVKNAGKSKRIRGTEVQIMHNGLLVEKGGYFGSWMEDIIKSLDGHHEPQEEKVFHEIVKRISTGGTMIELGSYWAYYSLWFNSAIKNATNICCEPDPDNLVLGERNAALNNLNMTFLQAAAGSAAGDIIDLPLDAKPGVTARVPVMSVDALVKEYSLKKLDLLHMDVQGFELDSIKGAVKTIKAGGLRFLIVSTHHYIFSGDPLTHFKCLELIKELGGHIIADHTIAESYSGDGLIAASFSDKDKDFHIDISINSSAHSLFRPYEYDLAKMIYEYEK